jgi:hypothetical protein
MSEQPRYEKEEKLEKEEEKTYEKQEKEQEKDWEEKWRRDPLGVIVWAVILIWAGIVFFVGNMGLWDSIQDTLSRELEIGISFGPWAIVLLGAGVIVLIEIAIRFMVPAYRRPVGGSLIFAAILIGVGLGLLIGFEVVWPAVLIIIGIGILLGGLLRQR